MNAFEVPSNPASNALIHARQHDIFIGKPTMFRSKLAATLFSCAVLCAMPVAALAQTPVRPAASDRGLSPALTRSIGTAVRNFARAMPATPPVAEGTNAAATAPDAGRAQRLALANQLIDLDGSRTAITGVADQIAPLISMGIQGEPGLSNLPAADKAKISEFMTDEFKTYFLPQLLVVIADYYADQLTTEELQSLVATFQTPVLRKYVGVQASVDGAMDARTDVLTQETAIRAMQKYMDWKKHPN